jgi:beta-N-acetylhexosaminidase
MAPVIPFLSIDEEGGLVDRLKRVMAPTPAASKLTHPDQAAEQAAIIGESLRILGFNMDFAPVVDVIDEERGKYSNGLFSRTYGSSREDVVAYASRFLLSLQANGIIGCIKHFPGLGAARVDSHEELPVVEIGETELDEVDLFPYRELLGTGMVHAVMVAHVSFSENGYQKNDDHGRPLPASLNPEFVTRMLREEMGFSGLVITDDLEMGAIIKNYGIGDACKMAIGAGADVLAICADPQNIRDGYQSVLAAAKIGEITEERLSASLERIAAAKSRLSAPLDFDVDRLAQLSDRTEKLSAGS